MTSKEAIQYYESEAQKEEIRSECARSKSEEKRHKAKAARLAQIAARMKQLFCRSYHTAALTFENDLD